MVIETPWYTGECRATSCLSCSATLSKQFPRFHSNYTANVVFQGQDMHAFFIHHHKQARNERKSFRRYRSSWLKKCMWVSRGIELYPQNGGQAAVVDAWAVHGIWWIKQNESFPRPSSRQSQILWRWGPGLGGQTQLGFSWKNLTTQQLLHTSLWIRLNWMKFAPAKKCRLTGVRRRVWPGPD